MVKWSSFWGISQSFQGISLLNEGEIPLTELALIRLLKVIINFVWRMVKNWYFHSALHALKRQIITESSALRKKCQDTAFFSGSCFPVFAFSQYKCGEIRTKKDSVFESFSCSGAFWVYYSGVFRTQSTIYDEGFLRK